LARLTILHTGDLHGKLNPNKVLCLSALRSAADLYFDCGDSIKTGNLGVALSPQLAWTRLHDSGCTASVAGNRESHVLESSFQSKLAGMAHPVLCANMKRKDGSYPLDPVLVVEVNSIKVGVFGVMVPIVTARMKSRFASAFLWEQPIPVAKEWVKRLRGNVDCLIALTHIGYEMDKKLADECPEIDLILGGHSHTILETPERRGNTWIAHTGSHAKYVGRYVWEEGQGLVSGELVSWP